MKDLIAGMIFAVVPVAAMVVVASVVAVIGWDLSDAQVFGLYMLVLTGMAIVGVPLLIWSDRRFEENLRAEQNRRDIERERNMYRRRG